MASAAGQTESLDPSNFLFFKPFPDMMKCSDLQFEIRHL